MTHLRELFKEIRHMPDPGLEERILLALRGEIEALAERKIWLARAGTFVSLFLFLGILFFAGRTLLQSEFWGTFSLLFSDLSVVANSFQNFFYLLLETIPVVPLVTLLLSLFAVSFSASIWMSLIETRPHGGFHTQLFTH